MVDSLADPSQLDAGMHPAFEGLQALPFYDEFDLSQVDVLLISQYVSSLEPFCTCVLACRGFVARLAKDVGDAPTAFTSGCSAVCSCVRFLSFPISTPMLWAMDQACTSEPMKIISFERRLRFASVTLVSQ